ncbi:MAG TPA: hypothetical protein VFZ91_11270 [Allosphingosinicella sp.]
MNRGSARRRLRLRRRRKGETFASKLSDLGDVKDPVRSSRSFDPRDVANGAEVVGHMGCCVVEAIGSAAVLVALLTVPAYLLTR